MKEERLYLIVSVIIMIMFTISSTLFYFNIRKKLDGVEINPEVEKLKFSYRTYHKDTAVYIYDNEDLKDGSVIRIRVQSANGYYSKEYTINIKTAKKTSTTTKILQGAVIGLAVTAAVVATAVHFVRKRKSVIVQEDEVIEPSNLPPTNNNNDQGNV